MYCGVFHKMAQTRNKLAIEILLVTKKKKKLLTKIIQ